MPTVDDDNKKKGGGAIYIEYIFNKRAVHIFFISIWQYNYVFICLYMCLHAEKG